MSEGIIAALIMGIATIIGGAISAFGSMAASERKEGSNQIGCGMLGLITSLGSLGGLVLGGLFSVLLIGMINPSSAVPAVVPAGPVVLAPLPTAITQGVGGDSVASPISNLLQNSSFEQGLSNWGYSERHVEGLYAIRGRSGQAQCSRQNLTANDAKGWIGLAQDVSIEGGKDYGFTGWLLLDRAIQFHVKVEWFNGSDYLGWSLLTNPLGNPPNGETRGDWFFMEGRATAPQNANMARFAFWHGVVNDQDNVPDSTFCVDDVAFGLFR